MATRSMVCLALLTALIVATCHADDATGGRDLFDLRNRFLEDPFPKTGTVPSVLVVESFETAKAITRDWQLRGVTVAQSTEHATEGKHALKVTFRDANARLAWRRASWDGFPFIRQMNFFDELRIDVFNPGDPVQLSVRMVNVFRFDLKPGHNEVKIDTRAMKAGRLMHFNLNPDGVFRVTGRGGAVLYLDNIRWIGPGLGRHLLSTAKCFDFGPAAWCRPQFLPIAQSTAYAPERGYGWVRPHAPKHRYDQRQSTTFKYNPVSELLGDMVRGFGSPLRVDLPPGKYRLHLVEGHVGYQDPMPSYWDLGVRIDDGEVVMLRRGARTFEEFVRFEYGRDRVDFTPDDDRWQSYMACRHRPLEHDFEVKGDHVRIAFVSDPPGMAQLAFMVIYPLDKSAAVEPELATLWREIRDRFNTHAFGPIPREIVRRRHVPGRREEYLDPALQRKKRSALKIAGDYATRGYLVFRREPVDPVYPDTVPSPDEVAAKVTAFAPPGEIETVTLSLLALKDLKDVRLDLSDFTYGRGHTIAADRADVRVVNCTCEMAARDSHGDWSFIPKPRWLVKRQRVDVAKHTCRRFWINVDVPADAAPGKYAARATVKATNAGDATVELELEVLPFKLDGVPPDIEHCVNVTYPYHPIIDRELLVFLRRRGALAAQERWKKIAAEARQAHAARIDAEFALMKRYGFRKAYMERSYVEKVPLTPEVTHGIDVVRYTQRSAAGVLSKDVTFLPLSGFTAEKIAEVLAAPGRTALLERGAMSIMPLWYPDQEGGTSRFQAGFFLWRSGNRRQMQWGWSRHLGDRYNPFCSEPGLYWGLVAPASHDWPTLNTSVVLEGAREGIVDYRYVATLRRLIAERRGTAAARKAETHLEGLRKRIQPKLGHTVQRVGAPTSGGGYYSFTGTDHAWQGADYRRERRALAELIVALTAAP